MDKILFKNQNDVSNDWLFYIENEAKSLAQRDDFAINNYIDREIYNPETQNYLSSDSAIAFINSTIEEESLHLNLIEGQKANFLPDWIRPRFRKLKRKIKEIFCRIVNDIGELYTKGIIKAVLLALIPAFATGFPAAVLPIIVGLIAYLIKFGIERTCPA